MDFFKTIQDLREEKKILDKAIETLEAMIASQRTGRRGAPGRRGRASMGEAERREVSRRMKRYWARRKKQAPKP